MKFQPTLKLTIFFLLTFALFNCKKDEPAAPLPRSLADVEQDFRALNISEGINDYTLEFNEGNFWNFRVIAPRRTGTQKYPLIIDLHGASAGAADAHQKTECYIEPAFEGKDYYIIVPNGGIELWNSPGNQEKVINLLLLANSNLAIDPEKVAITGYSNGGNGSWFFGETQPTLFSAAIPMASSYSTIGTDGNTRVMQTPIYVIHGENDELFPIDSTRKWVDLTVAAGSDVQFVEATGLGHYEPCEYVDYLKEAIVWLEETVWK